MKASEIQKIYMGIVGVRNKKLPVKTAFVLSRNIKKMESVVQDIDENRNELLKKYGEKDDNGELVVGENGQVKIPNAADFLRDMDEILNADIEITLDKLTEADIEKCDQDGYDKLTVDEIEAMTTMIVEEYGT